jgi:mutator protein MutT
MRTVVAAVIEHDGKLLACQRPRGCRFELMWEFPGGKVEPWETLPEALARELHEELGVTATIGPELFRTRHTYAGTGEPLDLFFFAADAPPAEIQNLEFEKIEWRTPESLPELEFLAADRPLIDGLARGAIQVPRNRRNRV